MSNYCLILREKKLEIVGNLYEIVKQNNRNEENADILLAIEDFYNITSPPAEL